MRLKMIGGKVLAKYWRLDRKLLNYQKFIFLKIIDNCIHTRAQFNFNEHGLNQIVFN